MPTARFQHNMTRGQLIAAQALIIFLLGGMVSAVVARRDFWPFSHFPMYAVVAQPGPINVCRLVGIPAEAPGTEHVLIDGSELEPFDALRLSLSLKHLLKTKGEAAREEVLRPLLNVHERRRLEGSHQGPRLQSLEWRRLHYEVRLDGVTPAPYRVELLAKIEAAD